MNKDSKSLLLLSFLLFVMFTSCKTENGTVEDFSLTEAEMLVIMDLRQTAQNFRPIPVMRQKIDSLYERMIESAIHLEDDTLKKRITESRIAFYKLIDLNASIFYRPMMNNASGASEFKEGFESDFLQKYYRDMIFLEDHLLGNAEGYLEIKDIK
jgi:hypothetical protein